MLDQVVRKTRRHLEVHACCAGRYGRQRRGAGVGVETERSCAEVPARLGMLRKTGGGQEPRCWAIQSQAERRDRGQCWRLFEGIDMFLYDLLRTSRFQKSIGFSSIHYIISMAEGPEGKSSEPLLKRAREGIHETPQHEALRLCGFFDARASEAQFWEEAFVRLAGSPTSTMSRALFVADCVQRGHDALWASATFR